jgi:hypothetical protein
VATVYRGTVCGSHWNGWRISYEIANTVVMEGNQLVKNDLTGTYHHFNETWHYRKEDAAAACLPELQRNVRMLEELIKDITADTGRSGCQSSATV